MSNCILAYPDRTLVSSTYTPVFSGGTWNASFPLTNLQNSLLSAKARSNGTTGPATKFYIDLGVARSVGVIGILRHNASASATVQVLACSDSGYTTLVWDSTSLSFWPEGYPTTENKKRYQEDFYIIPAASQTAKYWYVEIVDTANPAGYFELARCIIAPRFQPTINMIYGATIGLETDTQRQRTLGSVDYFDRKEPRRIKQFTLDSLTEAEAFDNVFDMQWDRGIDKEVLFVSDPEDTGKRLKQRSFLGTLRNLSPIEYPYFDGHSTGFEISEIL